MSTSGAVRSIFMVYELVDKVTAPMRKADELVNKVRDKTKLLGADTDAAGNKFQQAYTRASNGVQSYLTRARGAMTKINALVEEQRLAIAGLGAAFAAAGYMGYRYYREGTTELATHLDASAALESKLGDKTQAYVESLKEASGYQLNDTELTTKANMAMLLGIPEDALPTMTAMARAAGRQLEGDMSYYYESIMTGTARESKLWLDNLGIIVDIDEARNNYAKTLGISADAMTTEQEKLAFINEVLAHSDDLLKDVDFSQKSLKETLNKNTAAWANVNREMAEGALPVISATADASAFLGQTLEDMPGPMKSIVGTGGLVISVLMGITGTALIQLAAISLLAANWGQFTEALIMFIPPSISAAYAEGGLTAATYALGASLWALATNPITLTIMAIVGAAWLLWDIFENGWENSALGKAVNWMCETFPWFRTLVWAIGEAFNWLKGALETVWKFLEPIIQAIEGVLQNPIVKTIIDVLWGMTPMGMAENIWDLATGQELKVVSDFREIHEISNKALSSGGGNQNITVQVDASINTGGLSSEVTKADLEAMRKDQESKLNKKFADIGKGFNALM